MRQALSDEYSPTNFKPFPLLWNFCWLWLVAALLGLALLYGFMALFLGLFMFARVQLIAVLLTLAPLAAVLWVLPGRPRQTVPGNSWDVAKVLRSWWSP